jgi:hypothetical protein
MTSEPDTPPEPPAGTPSPGRGTWTRNELAARIQRTKPAAKRATRTPRPAAGPAVTTPPRPAASPARDAPGRPVQRPDRSLSPLSSPPFAVVLAVAPELRARYPDMPLSLDEALSRGRPPPGPGHHGRSTWAEVPAISQAPAQVRAIIRDTLAGWGLSDLAPDAERLASGLAADAADHATGHPMGLSLREYKPPGQPRWIRCAITDTSPRARALQPPGPGSQPGRGPDTVTAIAGTAGRDTSADGTTTWFTLTASPQPAAPAGPHHEHEPEAGG